MKSTRKAYLDYDVIDIIITMLVKNKLSSL
jgi:hypothetical protein